MADDEIVVDPGVPTTNPFAISPPLRKPAVIDEHWCDHAGCRNWGSFGYASRYGTEWYCGQHRGKGEAKR